ncbi:hypothetical protein PTSG_05985 [Salpingoeca rosetta]|uniref:Aspartyl/asparaginy/proline hydroxylase domain-containing protein n=1 Tax=Salpingoeca rosetta (strain ATCC 50818 / BSB-021) TaxID=946362 RepID=F2UDC5_SALR5|nr:uncharacterized protein PTSG_05985 [Salpingoeca rosetta]EGD74620.1 hypothetical protein PTSG_05985 [Salpingoeca rosetta]|eukprot:XP_004992877.1 hypothetical protein PTSG_05985 [Salpingoeca rosetta]
MDVSSLTALVKDWTASACQLPCWPAAIKDEWRPAVLGATGALGLYLTYKHLFTRPGFDPPAPGELYLAFECRKTFEKACDMQKDPFVFDLSREEFVQPLEANWTTIRDELKAYTANTGGRLAPFGHTHRMSSKSCWRVLSLRLWGVTAPSASSFFPKTMQLLHSIFPGEEWERVVGITFSQLEPQSAIAPHYGDTNANYRCHLGLIVPAGLPDAGMEIGDQQQEWKEGRVFAFNDAHYHRAWNKCDERRFVLILDVMRREHMPKRNHVCRYVMASFLLQRIANMCSIVKATKWTEHYTHAILYCLLFVPVNLGLGSSFVHWFMRA